VFIHSSCGIFVYRLVTSRETRNVPSVSCVLKIGLLWLSYRLKCANADICSVGPSFLATIGRVCESLWEGRKRVLLVGWESVITTWQLFRHWWVYPPLCVVALDFWACTPVHELSGAVHRTLVGSARQQDVLIYLAIQFVFLIKFAISTRRWAHSCNMFGSISEIKTAKRKTAQHGEISKWWAKIVWQFMIEAYHGRVWITWLLQTTWTVHWNAWLIFRKKFIEEDFLQKICWGRLFSKVTACW